MRWIDVCEGSKGLSFLHILKSELNNPSSQLISQDHYLQSKTYRQQTIECLFFPARLSTHLQEAYRQHVVLSGACRRVEMLVYKCAFKRDEGFLESKVFSFLGMNLWCDIYAFLDKILERSWYSGTTFWNNTLGQLPAPHHGAHQAISSVWIRWILLVRPDELELPKKKWTSAPSNPNQRQTLQEIKSHMQRSRCHSNQTNWISTIEVFGREAAVPFERIWKPSALPPSHLNLIYSMLGCRIFWHWKERWGEGWVEVSFCVFV